MGKLLKALVWILAGSLLLGSWLFACSGQEPKAQQQRRLERARVDTFYSRGLSQQLRRQGPEAFFAAEPHLVLHYRAGTLSQVVEQLKLHGYEVATTNAAFQRITLQVDSPEALAQLQNIAEITAVALPQSR